MPTPVVGTASNVSAGKPGVGGAIFVGATTATLPTSADATLTGFTGLGFVSEEGLTNGRTFDSNNIKSWDGSTVLTVENNFEDTFDFELLEVLNVDVLKEIYGAANVTGALSTGITVNVNASQHVSRAFVIDMLMRDNAKKRIVIPSASISNLAEIVYKNDEACSYGVTLTAMPDSSGNTHYEYIKAASTTSGGSSPT